MHLIWTILIGFVVGMIAKLITPGRGPSGFFLTAALGIGGSLAATYLGQTLGWYHAGQSAGFIGGVVGAAILLIIYHFLTRHRV
jgi:uncharacterized membrane protein YeaQ/YmgE (transglycosylase-associated protein family)